MRREMRILFFVISLKATTSFALKTSTVCCSTSRCTASQLLNWVSCAGGLPWRISMCSRASPHPFNWPKEEVRRTVETDGIQNSCRSTKFLPIATHSSSSNNPVLSISPIWKIPNSTCLQANLSLFIHPILTRRPCFLQTSSQAWLRMDQELRKPKTDQQSHCPKPHIGQDCDSIKLSLNPRCLIIIPLWLCKVFDYLPGLGVSLTCEMRQLTSPSSNSKVV
jgi:hypothetical protein